MSTHVRSSIFCRVLFAASRNDQAPILMCMINIKYLTPWPAISVLVRNYVIDVSVVLIVGRGLVNFSMLIERSDLTASRSIHVHTKRAPSIGLTDFSFFKLTVQLLRHIQQMIYSFWKCYVMRPVATWQMYGKFLTFHTKNENAKQF